MNYSKMKANADKQLVRYGMACHAITKVETDYDPSMSEDEINHATSVRTDGFCVKEKLSYEYKTSLPAHLLEVGDVQLLCTASLALSVGSVVHLGDESWLIIDPRPIKPTDLVVMYEAHARKVVV